MHERHRARSRRFEALLLVGQTAVRHRALESARCQMPRIVVASRASLAREKRGRRGKVSVHIRVGVFLKTKSTRCAAHSAARRPEHDGHAPRRLQENATKSSWQHVPQAILAKPLVDDDTTQEGTKLFVDEARDTQAVLRAGACLREESLEVLAHHLVVTPMRSSLQHHHAGRCHEVPSLEANASRARPSASCAIVHRSRQEIR